MVTKSTFLAPAASNTFEHSLKVAPVVMTSSTKRREDSEIFIFLEIENTEETFCNRWSLVFLVCVSVNLSLSKAKSKVALRFMPKPLANSSL